MLKLKAIAIIVAIGFLNTLFPTVTAEVVQQVLVKVNGEIITKLSFEQRQVSILRQRPEIASGTATDQQLRNALAESAGHTACCPVLDQTVLPNLEIGEAVVCHGLV